MFLLFLFAKSLEEETNESTPTYEPSFLPKPSPSLIPEPSKDDEKKREIQNIISFSIWATLTAVFLIWACASKDRKYPNRTYRAGLRCSMFYNKNDYELLSDYYKDDELLVTRLNRWCMGIPAYACSCCCYSYYVEYYYSGRIEERTEINPIGMICAYFMLCFFLFYICCVIVLFPFWLAYIFLSQYCFHEGDEAIEDLYNRKYAGELNPSNQNQQVVQQGVYEPINQNCVQPNQNYIQTNQNYTQMNQNYGQMNQNYVQVTPNYAPMNPNCVPMNPNYVPMNQNQAFNPPQVYDQSNPYTMNQPLI